MCVCVCVYNCVPGYRPLDVDECVAELGGACGPNSDCVNIPGSHICSCHRGYLMMGAGGCQGKSPHGSVSVCVCVCVMLLCTVCVCSLCDLGYCVCVFVSVYVAVQVSTFSKCVSEKIKSTIIFTES